MPHLQTFGIMELMQEQIRYNADISVERCFCVMPHVQIRYNDATPGIEMQAISCSINLMPIPIESNDTRVNDDNI